MKEGLPWVTLFYFLIRHLCGLMRTLILFLCLLFGSLSGLQAQWQLSEEGEIHIVTCGPYQGELYSAFGHSAIRVVDPQRRIDVIYNYGVFDFNQPNFYLNFTRGHLLYKLAVSSYQGFVDYYISEDRFVHEQVLDLNQQQKQAVFNFLQWNALPENSDYLYDYFYDNCATRVRDVFTELLGDSLMLDSTYAEEGFTIRQLCDMYLTQQPWGDLGIDLCLGLPMDKQMTTMEYMFLPDYLESGFAVAQVNNGGQWKPLVKERITTYVPEGQVANVPLWRPATALWSLLLLTVLMTYMGYKKKRWRATWDLVLFSVLGLLGWLLTLLWFFTDHRAAAMNFNIIWAMPLHFPLVVLLYFVRKPALKGYMGIFAIYYLLVLLFWSIFPQDLPDSLIPLVILLLLRAGYIFQHLRTTKSIPDVVVGE